ncbi:hypothetical protein [Flavobacterium sp. Arc2]|jgi:hypothetical protein
MKKEKKSNKAILYLFALLFIIIVQVIKDWDDFVLGITGKF